jgi:hypothetical protein
MSAPCKHGWIGNICGKCGWTKEMAMQNYWQRIAELEAEAQENQQQICNDMKEIRILKAENAKLRELVADAADDVACWGAYASPYFQEKHDLDGDIVKYKAALLRSK